MTWYHDMEMAQMRRSIPGNMGGWNLSPVHADVPRIRAKEVVHAPAQIADGFGDTLSQFYHSGPFEEAESSDATS